MGTMFPARRLSYGLLFGVYCGKSAEKTQKYMLLQGEGGSILKIFDKCLYNR